MDNGISVMIFSKASEIIRRLEADLYRLNFSTIAGAYPEIDIDYILLHNPDIILLDLTNVDNDTYKACDILQYKWQLPKHIIPVALISVSSMRQIPLNFPFVEFVSFPYDIIELGFRLRRVIIDNT